MGSVLPVLFLATAILTMVTTMHRIATKEKTQIGTLKALGFKNRRILLHYTSYGLVIGLLGYGVCKLIMSENGMMGTYFDMPDWSAAVPSFCYPVMAGTVVLLTVISFVSVRRQLAGTAADALRPYTPRRMKKSALERLPGWSRLRFGDKWNLRDLARHKSRSAMTLIGVGVLQWLLTALAGEYELKLMLGGLTYGVSVLLTFGVSLLVGRMVARKNRRIDMVGALKIAD